MAKPLRKPAKQSADSTYFLKLVLYMILGSQWLFIADGDGNKNWEISLPVGLIIGLGFAMHEHFKLDRKIEYAILLMSMLVGYWAQVGLFVAIH